MDEQTSRPLAAVEFTYDWYESFLERLDGAGFDFRTFSEGATAGEVLLRHDVDLSIEKALTTARIEAELGIEATYCVLLTSPLYNPLEGKRREQLRAIRALGHEVALHFSTHEYWPGDDEPDEAALESRIDQERDVFGASLSTRPDTVSFHVPPSWVLDREFDGFRSTYSPQFFGDIEYVADSGQRWRLESPEIPDRSAAVQVLTHPGLWGEDDADFRARVDGAVSDACVHARRKAGREFLDEGPDAGEVSHV